jgi:regulator of cell morphogenesis and NO signaling
MKIDADTIIGDIVKVNYKTAQVFEAHNIDFCCGGGISLNEACKKASINNNELITKL